MVRLLLADRFFIGLAQAAPDRGQYAACQIAPKMKTKITTYCRKTGKIKHPNKYEADQHANNMIYHLRYHAKAYKCPFCKGWHITTK